MIVQVCMYMYIVYNIIIMCLEHYCMQHSWTVVVYTVRFSMNVAHTTGLCAFSNL